MGSALARREKDPARERLALLARPSRRKNDVTRLLLRIITETIAIRWGQQVARLSRDNTGARTRAQEVGNGTQGTKTASAYEGRQRQGTPAG